MKEGNETVTNCNQLKLVVENGNKSKPLLSSQLFKFRLWDKRSQKFTTSGAYLSNTTLELDCISDVQILQFTGLIDKNGI